MKKNYLLIAAVAILLVIMTGVYKKIAMPQFSLPDFSKEKQATLLPEEAKNKVLEFVMNNNFVQAGTKVEAKDISEDSGMYKVTLMVGGKQEVQTYITKDGTKFFPQVMDMAKVEEEKKKAAEEASKPEEITKSDRPKVDLYVMSFCPYGNKAEDTLKPVYELLKNKVDFNFHYIVSSEGESIKSLHGQPEVLQNEREACVMRDYGKDKWLAFVTYVNANCGSDGACWETGAKNLSLDGAKITACVASSGAALMKADEKVSSEAGATGSPTMLINGTKTKKVYQYGNSEEYKNVICSAFSEAPEECAKALSAATSTASGGSCN